MNEAERLQVKLNHYWSRFFELTGEIRPPKSGEWIVNSTGFPVRADFDFEACSFPIIRQKLLVEEFKDE